MFGGPTRMFPRAPLWLSTDLATAGLLLQFFHWDTRRKIRDKTWLIFSRDRRKFSGMFFLTHGVKCVRFVNLFVAFSVFSCCLLLKPSLWLMGWVCPDKKRHLIQMWSSHRSINEEKYISTIIGARIRLLKKCATQLSLLCPPHLRALQKLNEVIWLFCRKFLNIFQCTLTSHRPWPAWPMAQICWPTSVYLTHDLLCIDVCGLGVLTGWRRIGRVVQSSQWLVMRWLHASCVFTEASFLSSTPVLYNKKLSCR